MTSVYFRPNRVGKALVAAGKRLRRESPTYGTWWLRYRDEAGRKVRESCEARMEAEAERLVHEKAMRAERVRAGLEKMPVPPITCAELLEKYMAASQHLASIKPMQSQLRRWVGPHFGKKLVTQVTPADCEALLQKSRDAGQAATTTRVLYIRARLVFEYACKKLLVIEKNPWASVSHPPLPRRAVKVLRPEQIGALLAAAGPWRPLLLVAILTGLRRGELAALRWEDIDWSAGANGVIHVRRSWGRDTTKGGKERLVPVHPQLRPELEAYRRNAGATEGLVFPSTRTGGMRYATWPVTALLRNIAARAGVNLPEGFTFHGLRKQFGSLVHQATGDLVTTQRLLGHANPQITAAVYLATDVGHLEQQMGKVRLTVGAADEHVANTWATFQGESPAVHEAKALQIQGLPAMPATISADADSRWCRTQSSAWPRGLPGIPHALGRSGLDRPPHPERSRMERPALPHPRHSNDSSPLALAPNVLCPLHVRAPPAGVSASGDPSWKSASLAFGAALRCRARALVATRRAWR
ncbi:tyrosine recombinase [Corallococcus coralloides DSM 2259]|uniref:Tyrosine recombinase n=1 Tax=Corallococcus coralloides (strain ATCC 25202 / DSM 2259 / NBRC 100086 / M2) TaxID=1144275 RepID=H8MVM7_CORCM|nr:site-specific integrase [Corallococcus coralloides]AFE10660.1 tyrosine recombinase [Corallococcus coralloides DSM 2259]